MLTFHGETQSADLQQLQSVQKSMLSSIGDFCSSRNIPYFLVAGSALGAVRHGDMIPWDDDIEIITFNVKQDPYIVLENIFSQYEINPYLAKYLPNKSSFDGSTEGFIATGRFENNIRTCSRTDLINIITASYDRAIN